MLSRKCGLVYKLNVVGFVSSCYDAKCSQKQSSSSITSSKAALHISCVFLCCHVVASKYEVLFQTWGKQQWKHINASNYFWK